MTDRILVHNGRAADLSWECGGYRFEKVKAYDHRVERLPRLAGERFGRSYPARAGAHVVTFEAVAVGAEAERASPWLHGGTALHDVLTLWSFAGGLPVLVRPIKRAQTSGDLAHVLADESEIVAAVRTAYRNCRHRPRRRRVWSSLLTYLEIAHQRYTQVDAVLLTSVLECLAPLRRGSEAPRYQPIVDLLVAVPTVAAANIDRGKIEALVVELYRIRNGFLHGGVRPYRENIEIDGVTVTTGRVVLGARKLAKLAVADALGLPETREATFLAYQVQLLFEGGSFVPEHLAQLLPAHPARAR